MYHLSLCRQAAEQPKAKQHGDGEINEQAGNTHQRFTNPESDGEIEDQYSIIKTAAQEYASGYERGRGEARLKKLAIEGKIGPKRKEGHHSPANVICNRHAKVCAGIGIIIYPPEEPSFAA